MPTHDTQHRPVRRGVLARSRGVWVVTVVATIALALWAASFWYHAAWISPNGTLVGLAKGEFHQVVFAPQSLVRTVPSTGAAFINRHATPLWWSGYFAGPPRAATITAFTVHWWAIGIAAGWWGVLWWRLRMVRERHECWQCAYDRRGIGPEMACPECGATGQRPDTTHS